MSQDAARATKMLWLVATRYYAPKRWEAYGALFETMAQLDTWCAWGLFFCENSRVKHKRIKVRSYDIECCALDGLAVGKMDDRNARNAKAPWRCPHISMEPGLSFRRLSCYICSISIEHPTVDPATPHRQGFTAPCGPEEPLPRTHPPNELDHAEECFAAFRGCYPQGTRQEAATVLPVCLAFREVRTGWAR